jgi:hypothetical protein
MRSTRAPEALRSRLPVLDIEASGLGAGSYPIEVGVVLPDGSGHCSLVRPQPDWRHWDPAAEAVHGIARATVLQHGRPVAEVAAALNRLLGGITVYTDAWSQDYSWLHRLYDAAEAVPNFRLASIESVLGAVEAERWNAIKAAIVARTQAVRHRASADARVIQATVHEWLEQAA